jgi:hypothetical protein
VIKRQWTTYFLPASGGSRNNRLIDNVIDRDVGNDKHHQLNTNSNQTVPALTIYGQTSSHLRVLQRPVDPKGWCSRSPAPGGGDSGRVPLDASSQFGWMRVSVKLLIPSSFPVMGSIYCSVPRAPHRLLRVLFCLGAIISRLCCKLAGPEPNLFGSWIIIPHRLR